jgi:hypothetical protein
MADATNSDAMQFALKQGEQQIGNSFAAKGGLLGTNAQQAGTKFAEENAAQFQNQAFNQWMAQQNQKLNATQSLAQVGQTAVNSVADAASNAALASGAAQAAGGLAQSNAYGKAFGDIANNQTVQNTLNGIFSNQNSTSSSQAAGVNGAGDPVVDTSGASGSLYSDERLKDDIEHVGYTNEGIPIYTYRMKSGGPKQMGVMAQDVEKMRPAAVKKDTQGFRMVDYGKLE